MRAAALLYGWFEAGWLRTRVLEVPVEGLPAALEGLRIAHLSDFHLGPPSRGSVAVRRAADWVRERNPDLVVVTGDLLSHPRGRGLLDEVLQGLDALAVLGNHDVGVTRDRVLARGGARRAARDAARRRVACRRAARCADPGRRNGPAPARGGAGRRTRRSRSGSC